MNRDLVPTVTAADEIGVNPETLRGWARSGHVTAAWRTPGGRYRWDVADLKRQLDPENRT